MTSALYSIIFLISYPDGLGHIIALKTD
ncbi:pyrroline-5-carboxylate reductase [Lyngbya sp. PCC 8106]|nr:pyrroline-5-carboxylate reductase [Lyngbya sp. PCC 8106]